MDPGYETPPTGIVRTPPMAPKKKKRVIRRAQSKKARREAAKKELDRREYMKHLPEEIKNKIAVSYTKLGTYKKLDFGK
jgi:hypothetical protein